MTERGTSHQFDLSKLFTGSRIESAKLLFNTRDQGERYLLLDVTGPSRGPGGESGMCGAGSESNLVWLKLDSDWRVLDSASEPYDSCLYNLEAWPDSLVTSKYTFAVCTQNYSQSLAIRMNYDAGRAPDGIKVRKIPWTKQEDSDCYK